MQIKKDERNEIKSTSHSRYRCQYHIIFAPKSRRKEIYGQMKKDIGEILRTLCKQKNVEILEAEACADHIHMLVSIPPYLSVAQFMGFLKGKSSLMIYIGALWIMCLHILGVSAGICFAFGVLDKQGHDNFILRPRRPLVSNRIIVCHLIRCAHSSGVLAIRLRKRPCIPILDIEIHTLCADT